MTPTAPPATRRRRGLALRICLLTTSVALVTALVAGALAVGLIRRAEPTGAQNQLGRLADAVAQEIDAGTPARSRPTLRALRVGAASIANNGTVTGAPLARDAVTPAQARAVLDGRRISARTSVHGQDVFVQARPTGRGGVVLVQRRVDAETPANAALRRLLVALAVGAAVAVGLGLIVAWRLARPLRRTAAAAHALAAGRRDVSVRPDGPSEIAAVAEALNSLSAGLARSEERQREFLLSVSHDLRTPLTALRGYAESLADGVSTGEAARHAGTVMLAEAERLERMVADLLDLARLDAADLRIDTADVDLTDLLRGAAVVWAERCAAAGVRFGTDVAAGPVWVRTDPGRLRQVLDGLLENALRVTPAQRPIVLAGGAEASSAVAEVRDGGPGLSDDDLAVAFDRGALYERYRGVRRVGTGLGLAIVHRLVTRLGGSVEAGHAAEGGARFTLRLPLGPAERPTAELPLVASEHDPDTGVARR